MTERGNQRKIKLAGGCGFNLVESEVPRENLGGHPGGSLYASAHRHVIMFPEPKAKPQRPGSGL